MWVAANTSIANRSKGHEGISASVQWSNPLAAAAQRTPAAPMARRPGASLNVYGTAEVRTMRGKFLAAGLSITSQRL